MYIIIEVNFFPFSELDVSQMNESLTQSSSTDEISLSELIGDDSINIIADDVVAAPVATMSYHLSEEEKIEILIRRAGGESLIDIAAALGRGRASIRRWLSRWCTDGNVRSRPRGHRSRVLTPAEVSAVVLHAEIEPTLRACEIRDDLCLDVSAKTVV